MRRVYLSNEDGEELDLCRGWQLLQAGPTHQVPGMGLGRERHGFITHLELTDTRGQIEQTVTTKDTRGCPVRVSLWSPHSKTYKAWLVPVGATAKLCDELADKMHPDRLDDFRGDTQ